MTAHPSISSLEVLESRIAPAFVAAAAVAGTLVVGPEAGYFGSHITVVQTGPAAFDVFDTGELLGSFDEVEAVQLTGSYTTDILTVDMLEDPASRFEGPVSVDRGGGDHDQIAILAGAFGGDLSIIGGGLTNLTTDPGTIVAGEFYLCSERRVTVARLEGAFADVRIEGTGYVTLGDFTAAGDVSVQVRPRSGFGFDIEPGARIAGDFVFENLGRGNGILDLQGATIAGAVDLHLGGGDHQVRLNDCAIGGGLRVQGAGLDDGISIAATSVLGPVELGLSGGTNYADITDDSFFGSTLTITATGGALANTVTLKDSTVTGLVTVRLMGGLSGVAVSGSELLGGAVLRGDGQAMTFRADAATMIAGRVDFVGSNGPNVFEIAEVGDLLSIRYVGGAGEDDFSIGGSGGTLLEVDADLGGKKDRADIGCIDFLRLTVDGGGAVDTIVDADFVKRSGGSYTSFERLILG